MDLTLPQLALVLVAALGAGAVNALAGGGTLLVFPALTAVGVPTVNASITTTIALNAGYLGGSAAQRDDLAGQRARLAVLGPAAVLGGITGAYLLSVTSEDLFRAVVPWLIFAACGLLAGQDRLKASLERRRAGTAAPPPATPRHGVGPGLVVVTFTGAVYGGYFGAGLGIVLLAVLGLVLDDDLRRVNALKQVLSLCTNLAAAVLLLFSGRVAWAAAAVVAVGALGGGVLGGRIAGSVNPKVLRAAVVAIGAVVGLIYLVKR